MCARPRAGGILSATDVWQRIVVLVHPGVQGRLSVHDRDVLVVVRGEEPGPERLCEALHAVAVRECAHQQMLEAVVHADPVAQLEAGAESGRGHLPCR
jgi:hypothetical protein